MNPNEKTGSTNPSAPKTRTILIYRHADYKELMLTSDGEARAERVGAEWLRDRNVRHLVTTPYFRTTQTAVAMARGAGDWRVEAHDLERNWVPDTAMEQWDRVEGAAGEWNMEKMRDADPTFVTQESVRCGAILRGYALACPDEGSLVIVAHTPSIEMAVLGATGILIKALEPCEGVELEVREGAFGRLSFRLVREFRHGSPQPSS